MLLAPSAAWASFFDLTMEAPATGFIQDSSSTIMHANGIGMRNLELKNITGQQPVASGNSYGINSFFDVFFDISMNGGASWTPVSTLGKPGSWLYSPSGSNTFNTEMTSLSLSGGTLPGGIMIRESPTRASVGVTSYSQGGGGYQVNSFFDIFTEVSLDGGQTWSPDIAPPSLMTATPEPATLSLLALGGLALLRRRKR
jgi:hypothetical protein